MIARRFYLGGSGRIAYQSHELSTEFAFHGVRLIRVDTGRKRCPGAHAVGPKYAVDMINDALVTDCGPAEPTRIIMGQDIKQHAPDNGLARSWRRTLDDITDCA